VGQREKSLDGKKKKYGKTLLEGGKKKVWYRGGKKRHWGNGGETRLERKGSVQENNVRLGCGANVGRWWGVSSRGEKKIVRLEVKKRGGRWTVLASGTVQSCSGTGGGRGEGQGGKIAKWGTEKKRGEDSYISASGGGVKAKKGNLDFLIWRKSGGSLRVETNGVVGRSQGKRKKPDRENRESEG